MPWLIRPTEGPTRNRTLWNTLLGRPVQRFLDRRTRELLARWIRTAHCLRSHPAASVGVFVSP
jgi:hypothetical protein